MQWNLVDCYNELPLICSLKYGYPCIKVTSELSQSALQYRSTPEILKRGYPYNQAILTGPNGGQIRGSQLYEVPQTLVQ